MNDKLPSWLKKELDLSKTQQHGSRGTAVKRIQEWLTFHGVGVNVDGKFGPVTRNAVRNFQKDNGLGVSGKVTRATFDMLAAPLSRAIDDTRIDSSLGYAETALAVAEQNLAEHPVEIGGQNRGPWVRAYMKGKDGEAYLWCAGFVCFMLYAAGYLKGQKSPINFTFSCDIMGMEAKNEGRFVSERNVSRSDDPQQLIAPGDIFLIRRSGNDWIHTGIVREVNEDMFRTIEGNTNEGGSRNGFEVASRWRSYNKMEFIKINSP